MKSSKFVNRFSKTQKGYTIVELSVAVAIAGVLVVGAIALVQTVLATSRANDTITLSSRTFAQIDKVFDGQESYSGMNLTVAKGLGIWEGYTTTGAGNTLKVVNKFNYPIYIAPQKDLPQSDKNLGYALTFTGVPRSVCADIVFAADSMGIRGVAIQPENSPGSVSAAPTGITIDGTGKLSVANSEVVKDLSKPNGKASPTDTAKDTACGTSNATVAIHFVNWRS